MFSKLSKLLQTLARGQQSRRRPLLLDAVTLRQGEVSDAEVLDAIKSVPDHFAAFIDPFELAGMGTPVETTEGEFQWGEIATWQLMPIQIDSAAADAGSTPTTVLRRGLLMGQVTATQKFKQYNPTATDGTQVAVGALYMGRNLLDPNTAAAVDHVGVLVIAGRVKSGNLILLDEQARRQLQGRFIFDDRVGLATFGGYNRVLAKTGNYQVTAADTNTNFTTTGNAAPINFTLPAIANVAPGWRARFSNVVDQNMTVTAPAGLLIAFNNLAATSVALSTAGNKIGSGFEIMVADNAAKYIAIPYGQGTVTVA